jgi:hypothetical protein
VSIGAELPQSGGAEDLGSKGQRTSGAKKESKYKEAKDQRNTGTEKQRTNMRRVKKEKKQRNRGI